MKAVRFIIPKTSGNSFRVQHERQTAFYETIHFHPEYQLTLFINGEGTCFIGNKVDRFKAGDIFFLGKNLPHVFKSDPIFYNDQSKQNSECISIFFKDETFGREFFETPELSQIKRLLELSAHGIKLDRNKAESNSNYIKNLKIASGFNRFRILLDLLDRLANSSELNTLSTVEFTKPSSMIEHERIDVVFRHISNHFQEEITLNEIAEVANMTVNSFCRYFKQRTRKTFTDFLNEFRIDYACKLIAGSNQNFSAIAINSGYNNTSYFNRKFKQLTGMSPIQYRRKYGTV